MKIKIGINISHFAILFKYWYLSIRCNTLQCFEAILYTDTLHNIRCIRNELAITGLICLIEE